MQSHHAMPGSELQRRRPRNGLRGWVQGLGALAQRFTSAHWPMVIAAMACAVLLLAFERVVRQAVQQGELRQIAARDRSDAIWRCKALKTRTARAECRQGLT